MGEIRSFIFEKKDVKLKMKGVKKNEKKKINYLHDYASCRCDDEYNSSSQKHL